MKVEDFNNFLSKNSISTDNWKIYYDFSKVTGGFILLNELKPYQTQFSGNCVYAENNPGLIVGINTGRFNGIFNVTTTNVGSGLFSGNTTVRLTDYVNAEDWTMFLTVRHSGNPLPNRASILVTNQTNLNDSSGFCMGINAINKFFIEYNNVSGKFTYTSDTFAKDATCFSLSKKSNDFELSVHDIANSENSFEKFRLNNYVNSNTYYLGSTYNLDNRFYSGFVGYMDDFIFMSGYVAYNERNNLSKGIFATGIIPASTVKIISGYNKISTSTISTGIIIGTGITGYATVTIGTIPRKNGASINICAQSGLYGPIYGEQIIFTTGSETGSRIININIPEQIRYDARKILNFSDYLIKYLGVVDSGDFFQATLYSGDLVFDNYRYVNFYDPALNMQVMDLKFTGQGINLFENGIYQISGNVLSGIIQSGNYNMSGRYIYSNNLYQEDEAITYFDVPNIPYLRTGISTQISWHISSGVITSSFYSANNVSPFSLYLNGQRLIENFDYTKTIFTVGGQFASVTYNFSTFGGTTTRTGELILAALKPFSYIVTGGLGYDFSPPFRGPSYIELVLPPAGAPSSFNPNQRLGLSKEQLFLNGVLLEKDKSYIKTTLQSPLYHFHWPAEKPYLIYNNETYGFSGKSP